MSSTTPLIDPAVFPDLKEKIEEETKVKDALTQIVSKLEGVDSYARGLLTRVHATPRKNYPQLLAQVEAEIRKEIDIVKELSEYASQYPYYKYNQKWSWAMTHVVFTVVLCGYLGGMATPSSPGEIGRLLKPEDISEIFQVPVNLKEGDAFHITLEEYLTALTQLTDELARLATNSVTLQDFDQALQIHSFLKDLFAGFLLLNLKNDPLRKRVDGVKYAVKKTEEIVYDLTVRKLVASPGGEAATEEK
ncbi:related to translin [Cephalotrichum gorgonifer]|uniref:Related to translin n=1 Tax=Cephalotrichum gorgonifer TaxID=2041049 RepID=A0AAE8MR88_9PEZI|nr:related to translin [Cephalotrichum gorgonifer]